MTSPTSPPALPDDIADAARHAADRLFEALRPVMGTAAPTQITTLWQVVKLLNAVSGGLDSDSTPEADRLRERWEETAALAANITDQALSLAATGMTPQQAADRVIKVDASDVMGTATAHGGVVELTPPDHMDTCRTLTVTIRNDAHYTLAVTADRGPAPHPRPHTPATLLRTAHHLQHLAATLGELILEPETDGTPLCGNPDDDVTCEICQSTTTADVARTVDVTKPWHHQINVCSTTCARAAHAGEHIYWPSPM
jgi:hypothetical protein